MVTRLPAEQHYASSILAVRSIAYNPPMDSRRKFSRVDLPYYQDWIRKVSGRKSIRVVLASADDMASSFPFRRAYGDGETDEEAKRRHREYFKYGVGWAWRRKIYLNVGYIEWLGFYTTSGIRALLLHEAGHLVIPRNGHGWSGREFVAQVYALRKACRLGLEAELQWLRYGSWCWYFGSKGVNARKYRVSYMMLKGIGVY